MLKSCLLSKLVVDVGANIGYFSFIAALSGCRVISFEPVHYNVRQIERTMQRNNLPNWRVYRNAVSSVTGGVVHLHTTDGRVNAGNHKIRPGGSDHAYTVRLDDVIKEDIAFMKIDVEGYEAFVVSGARDLFCKYTVNAVVLEMTEDIKQSGCDWQRMVQWFLSIGYQMRSFHTMGVVGSQGRDANMLLVMNIKQPCV